LAGSGTVRRVWEVREIFGGLDVVQPYMLVATEYTPADARSSLLGVDAIDAGSVEHLEVGDQITVRYSGAAPRRVRLGFGTRTFESKNRGSTRMVLAGASLLVLIVAGTRWWLSSPRRARLT
jgi:hypothetical protein